MRNIVANRRYQKVQHNPVNTGSASHFSVMEPLEARQLMSATVYTVTNTLDNSHHGSLRWAINQVNKDAGKKGTDTINFDIAGSGLKTIAPLSQLPAVKYPVKIDATTQPDYTNSPLIEINGNQTPGYAGIDALIVNGDNSTVQGFEIEHFSRAIVSNGDNDLITENLIGVQPPTFTGTDTGFTKAIDVYGSNTTVSKNMVASHNGAEIMLESQSNSNTVAGNLVGDGKFGIDDSVDSDHNQFNDNLAGNNYIGIEIDGHYNHVGDGQSSNGNWLGGADNPNAIGIELNSGQNVVATNTIMYNGEVGIYMGYNDAATDTVTGQVKSIAGNHNTVQDNLVANNGQNGITLDDVHGNTIGGTGTLPNGDSESNTINQNTFDGIYVGAHSVQNTFSNNAIDYNGSFGIELASGANDDQPAPTLTEANNYSYTTVGGNFRGSADSTYHIEFFITSSGTPNQGASYLGSIDVVTDDHGYLSTVSSTDSKTKANIYDEGAGPQFTVQFTGSFNAGVSIVTATATNQAGDTSAFSNGLNVEVDS